MRGAAPAQISGAKISVCHGVVWAACSRRQHHHHVERTAVRNSSPSKCGHCWQRRVKQPAPPRMVLLVARADGALLERLARTRGARAIRTNPLIFLVSGFGNRRITGSSRRFGSHVKHRRVHSGRDIGAQHG
jgi:hypothetical protein